MKTNPEKTIQLTDPDTRPTTENIKGALGKSYAAYEELINTITNAECNLSHEWRYYNDGKAWLCKVVYKKKTVLWLSVWNGFFKTAFNFTEKTSPGVLLLDIDSNIKTEFRKAKLTGRLLPLIVDIKTKKQIADVLNIIKYKKTI